MFDIGFWEMAFIGVIALIVIGPKRLPGFARTVGFWVGKGRRMINEVKADIKQEMSEQELKEFRELKQELSSAGSNIKNVAQSAKESVGLKQVQEELKNTADDLSSTLKMETDEVKQVASASSTNKKKRTSKPTSSKKKNTSKKPAAKKTSAKKASTKKISVKKSASKKTTSKKTVSKKSAPKKPASRKSSKVASAAKKPARKKAPTKKASPKPSAGTSPGTSASRKKTSTKKTDNAVTT